MAHVVAVVASLLASLFVGFVVSKGWGWFVVPLGVKGLNLFQALGLTTLFQIAALWSSTPDGGGKLDPYKHVIKVPSYAFAAAELLGAMYLYHLLGGAL